MNLNKQEITAIGTMYKHDKKAFKNLSLEKRESFYAHMDSENERLANDVARLTFLNRSDVIEAESKVNKIKMVNAMNLATLYLKRTRSEIKLNTQAEAIKTRLLEADMTQAKEWYESHSQAVQDNLASIISKRNIKRAIIRKNQTRLVRMAKLVKLGKTEAEAEAEVNAMIKAEAEAEAEAEVEFVARFKPAGTSAWRLHERSRFVLQQGRWWYLDGVQLA